MNGLIVFNNSNDIVFKRFNQEFEAKIREIAESQGLITENSQQLDNNIVLQIFSPVSASQKIMFCQFDNTYSSFQCENGLNFAFSEFLGYVFLKISDQEVDVLKRKIGVCVAITKHLYGANLFAPQANKIQEDLLSDIIDVYEKLYESDQTVLLEAMPQLIINTELKNIIRKNLEAAVDRLRDFGYTRTHILMFVCNKFLGVYSSRNALALSPSDILFLSLLSRTLQETNETKQLNRSVAIFLQGENSSSLSGCVPCIAHISQLDKGIITIQIVEYANLYLASSMYDTFFVLQKICNIQMQGDTEAIKPTFENLESFVKQTLDALRRAKLKSDDIDTSHKKFASKWENLKRMYNEYLKTFERELVNRIESIIPSFVEDLKTLFTLSCCDSSTVSLDQLPEVAALIEGKLLEYSEFLAVKAERNLTIEAYLEDFPGLVHFIYIDRTKGTMIAPDMNFTRTTGIYITKKTMWSMVEFTRDYLKKGHTLMMWKDNAFHYSYMLWFEDQSSSSSSSFGSIKPVDLQQYFLNTSPSCGAAANNLRPQNEPGLLAEDYYQQLCELCFPKLSPNKIKCYEMFCIHIGLVNTSCAMEHCRRLITTITEALGNDCL